MMHRPYSLQCAGRRLPEYPMQPQILPAMATMSAAAAAMEQHAADAAAMLRLLASERRLIVLCTLIAEGESPVGRLAERAGLSQPAMSQHLAKLREDGLVATRRAGTTIHYRIADPRVARLMGTLHDIFCAEPA
jgi:DNA-binding transcriptional ArsR family regulator